MRDEVIYRMHEANARRVMLLLKQFEFLNTRQMAYEIVLRTPWSRIKAVFNPAWLTRAVELKQKALLDKCALEMEAALSKPVPVIQVPKVMVVKEMAR